MYDDPNKFLAIILVTTMLSYIYCIIIIFLFKSLRMPDKSLKSLQSTHYSSTARFGGIAMLMSIISVEIIFGGIFRLWFLWSILPIFIIGIVEDFHFETKPIYRLIVGSLSSILAIYLSNTWLTSVDLEIFDYLLSNPSIGIFFTVFASVGMINAINLIDGVNGLAAAKTVMISIGIFLVASKVGEQGISAMGALIAASSLGLFFINFPNGRIFMGDAGAYTLGFLMAWQMIILLARHPELSAWSLLAIVFWPVMDTLFSIVRRVLKGKPTNRPDLLHFHQLIMRSIEIISKKEISRSISNPLATTIILPLTSFPIIFGIKYSHDVSAGLIIILISSTLYVLSYYTILLILKNHKIRNIASNLTMPFWIFISNLINQNSEKM